MEKEMQSMVEFVTRLCIFAIGNCDSIWKCDKFYLQYTPWGYILKES